eukprot:707798-Hanusia_phi.AAC.2
MTHQLSRASIFSVFTCEYILTSSRKPAKAKRGSMQPGVQVHANESITVGLPWTQTWSRYAHFHAPGSTKGAGGTLLRWRMSLASCVATTVCRSCWGRKKSQPCTGSSDAQLVVSASRVLSAADRPLAEEQLPLARKLLTRQKFVCQPAGAIDVEVDLTRACRPRQRQVMPLAVADVYGVRGGADLVPPIDSEVQHVAELQLAAIAREEPKDRLERTTSSALQPQGDGEALGGHGIQAHVSKVIVTVEQQPSPGPASKRQVAVLLDDDVDLSEEEHT